ncbi:glycosyltransferase family 4 protein [Paenibacillus thermotolerans]|uniref:glycosyltransferase family 4 protein n=1 Tax=Paenibacillus thermotolerans TaxID=3027807 RepID=UPI00236841E2|nr:MULTISPECIES: glycosyltransferase family 4 protein [unclassified Paenibacillus]
MIVVHAPSEIASQMGTLCYGLRRAGVRANGYNWFRSYIGYKLNIVNTDAYELAKLIDPLVKYCDIFHFHNGNTFVTDNLDLPLIAETGKKLVMHHWGNDVRSSQRNRKLNPYSLPPSYLSDEQIHKRLLFLSKYIPAAVVQDFEVFPYVSDYYRKVFVLPLACDISSFTPSYPQANQRELTIVHAPTNRDFKGSDHVERAIKLLNKKARFTYKLVERMNHEQALAAYQSADIVIDQLLCGSYGMVSVEAMAMGKVVVAFVRDDVRERLPPDLPIVVANPDTLYSVLLHLFKNPELRHEIGKASRAFAEKHHSVEHVANQLITIYRQL